MLQTSSNTLKSMTSGSIMFMESIRTTRKKTGKCSTQEVTRRAPFVNQSHQILLIMDLLSPRYRFPIRHKIKLFKKSCSRNNKMLEYSSGKRCLKNTQWKYTTNWKVEAERAYPTVSEGMLGACLLTQSLCKIPSTGDLRVSMMSHWKTITKRARQRKSWLT